MSPKRGRLMRYLVMVAFVFAVVGGLTDLYGMSARADCA